jgi:succinate dehydrogenase / fumarate reductase membrane anchor subunit
MVKVVGTFGRSGVHDYVLLRATAVILLIYGIYLLTFITTTHITYATWSAFFGLMMTKVLTLFALIAMLVHAWIGLWQVLTDYVKNAFTRGILQFILTSVAIVYVLFGFVILWGV